MDKIRERLKPDELIGLVAQWAGFQNVWHPMSLTDFVNSFNWRLVPMNDIIVDPNEII